MPQHHKVESELKPEELEKLKDFIREKNYTRSVDECHTWVMALGYTIGRTAVSNWLAKFAMEDRFRRSSELAAVMKNAISGGNFDDIAAAANQQLVNVVFEQASRLQAEGDLDAEQLELMTRSLKNLVGTKAQHTKMLAERFDQQAKKLAEKRAITQADIDEVRKAVFG